jgi:hypothetical protein
MAGWILYKNRTERHRGKTVSPSQAKERSLRRNKTADTLISDFYLQNCKKINICFLTQPVCDTLLRQT